MKKHIILKKFMKAVVSFAWIAIIWSANTTCAFCTYQEEAPEGLKRFSKVE